MAWMKGLFGNGDHFKKGYVVESTKTSFVVEKMLGEGGFGAVYKVHDKSKPDNIYAMKVEKKLESREHSKLKMEIAVLQAVTEYKDVQKHFTVLIDRGKKPQYFFLVMELVGKSVRDLQLTMTKKAFSMGSGCNVAHKCLEAIEALHNIGFIHRDVKPANFAIGLNEKMSSIYLLDFGIARKIFTGEGKLKTPREKCYFKGTVKYASVTCHRREETGCKDDVEGWIYLFTEILSSNGLPWKNIDDDSTTLKMKENARTNPGEIFSSFQHFDIMHQMLKYVDELRYIDKVDYQFLYKGIKQVCVSNNGKMDDPLDWENGKSLFFPLKRGSNRERSGRSGKGVRDKSGKERKPKAADPPQTTKKISLVEKVEVANGKELKSDIGTSQ